MKTIKEKINLYGLKMKFIDSFWRKKEVLPGRSPKGEISKSM